MYFIISFPGLRCHNYKGCQYWRWFGPAADPKNPRPTVCTENLQRWSYCKHRGCELTSINKLASINSTSSVITRALANLRPSPAPGNDMWSGGKDCYIQIEGLQKGCYRQDVTYWPTAISRNILYGVPAWGKCAQHCKDDPGCKFWTWASTSCSNCSPGTCDLFEGDMEPEMHDGVGHISGSRNCQDIGLPAETYEKPLFDSKVMSAIDDRFDENAFCESPCPAQEVPGYR